MGTSKVVKNAGWIIAARLVQAVLSFVIGMLTARFLGPSNYGLINYAISIVAFFTPIMELGITNVIVHQLIEHKDEEGKSIGTAITLNLLSSVGCLIGIAGFAIIANWNEPETILVCILYSMLLLFKAIEIIQYWFQAHLLSKYSSIASLIAYVVVSAYKVFLLATHKSIYWFALSYVLDNFLVALLLAILYKKLGGDKLSFSKTSANRLLSAGKYYIVSSMMVTIFAQTDKIMLKGMLGKDSVGYYSAAIVCAGITGFVVAAIIDSFRPVIFENKKRSLAKFEESLRQLYSIIIYFSLAQSVVMTLGAELIVGVVYGSQYSPSVTALRIVVWYTTFAYLGSVRNIWLLAENKQKYLWIVNLSGAVANVLLNFCLIPYLGVNGAAIASLVTQFFTNVIIGYIIKPIRPNNRIMVSSLNPKVLIYVLKKITKREKKTADNEGANV